MEGSCLSGKIGLNSVCEFYTQLYTFRQRGLEKRMDKGFAGEYEFFGCTFNPFVVGSTPAGPTKI